MQSPNISDTPSIPSTGDGLARVRNLGRSTAQSVSHVMDTAKQRWRDRDFRGAVSDVRRVVQERPVAALVTAAILGFVLVRSLARR